jgi:hypothetical protein
MQLEAQTKKNPSERSTRGTPVQPTGPAPAVEPSVLPHDQAAATPRKSGTALRRSRRRKPFAL